jgi:hypothetical protein
VLIREHDGRRHHVMVVDDGFVWNGTAYPSLSRGGLRHHRHQVEWTSVLWTAREGNHTTTKAEQKKALRCAIYTRISTDAGLEQDFNSLGLMTLPASSKTHSRKQGLRYRHYTSRALMEGRRSEAGTIARVSAEDVETRVAEALANAKGAKAKQDSAPDDPRTTIQTMVARVNVAEDQLTIELTDTAGEALGQSTLCVPWAPKPGRPKRDLVLPVNGDNPKPRPMHAERRAKHLRAIALGCKWLQDLITGKAKDADAIAALEDRSTRSVNMMISLAFVAPDIIEAAAAGRLPRGIGVARLIDLPLSWAKQKEALGLPARF